MSIVQTLRGPIDSSELGPTLSHEHLCSGFASMEKTHLFDLDEAVRRATEALREAYDAGIRTIIDCTPIDLGRQPRLFERVAGATPMHVVAAVGVYRSIPISYRAWNPDTYAEYFLHDIEVGIEGTGIRAGIIKIAWDIETRLEGLREPLETAARGAARAAKAGGVPITCHTSAIDRHGDRLIEIFHEEGLDLRAVTIGHTNDSTDTDYVLGLAKKGANVGLDRFSARRGEEEMARRAQIALDLANAGYAEQVSLSHDGAGYSLTGGPATGGPRAEDPKVWRAVPDWEVPWLRSHGVTEDQIDAIMVRSTRRTFEAAAAMKSSGG
jgi:phosphotriesterase-related protein